jgi:hypothetical protein
MFENVRTSTSSKPKGLHGLYSYANRMAFSRNVKVKLSLYRTWGPSALREFEAATFSDIQFIDGGTVVSRFLPPGRFLVLISVRG